MCQPVIDVEATCANLKRLCADRDLSVMRIKSELGLESAQAVYKWFSGKNLPSIDNLILIAQLLEVSLEEILVTHNTTI